LFACRDFETVASHECYCVGLDEVTLKSQTVEQIKHQRSEFVH